jgi:hypothetical protein
LLKQTLDMIELSPKEATQALQAAMQAFKWDCMDEVLARWRPQQYGEWWEQHMVDDAG